MRRSLPDCPGRPQLKTDEETVKKTYTFELITPMVGGGVEAGKPDPVTPIRASSIRGQLRFWWRATRGATCSTVEDLAKKEGKIFGTTERPSPLRINVHLDNKPKFRKANRNKTPYGFGRYDAEMYTLFPLTQDRNRDPPDIIKEGLRFGLELTFPNEYSHEIYPALRAWANFGGIGARTRRGLGAVFCKEFAFKDVSAIKDWLHKTVEKDTQRDWSILSRRILYKMPPKDPLSAWREGIKILKEFRQGKNVGRNPGCGNRPGRSRWPEAETIRRYTGPRYHRKYPPKDYPEGFPRATMGLPIIFEFYGWGNRPKAELQPCGGMQKRMASPLIFRPLRLSSGDALPIIAQLSGPSPEGVVLLWEQKKKRFEKRFDRNYLENPEFGKYKDSPMKNRSSCIDGFWDFAGRRGFKEVFP